MRLLKADTLELKEFVSGIPPYAILSHTWGDEEVTFHDLPLTDAGARTEGGRKIRACAALALSQGYQWIWVDTCCINKTSSAELSEAINSMFRWYSKAAICYAYLADVHDMTDEVLFDFYRPTWHEASARARDRVQGSRWFGRGWTLQELIAPRRVEFYSAEWKNIGTKAGLSGLLAEWTKIPVKVLQGGALSKWPASVKMSWASGRSTTREEDAAYCLLGIFDVHMPLLYGEGARAFIRLQEEILRRFEDLSLLLWTDVGLASITEWFGVLAQTAWSFSEDAVRVRICAPTGSQLHINEVAYGRLQITQRTDMVQQFPPATITSRGILATLLMRPVMMEMDGDSPASGSELELEPTMFAWVLAMQSVMVGDPQVPKPYMVGLPLVFLHGLDGNRASVESVLGEQDKPLVAARGGTSSLLLLDAEYMDSLVPRQVYLTATHKEEYDNPGLHSRYIDTVRRSGRLLVGSDTLGIHDVYVCEKNPRVVGTWDRWMPFHEADIWPLPNKWNAMFGKVNNPRKFRSVGVLPLSVQCRNSPLADDRTEISDVAVCMATALSPGPQWTLFITAQTWTWGSVQTANDIRAAYIKDDGYRYADRAYVRLECGHLAVLTARWDVEDTEGLDYHWSWRNAVLEISFP